VEAAGVQEAPRGVRLPLTSDHVPPPRQRTAFCVHLTALGSNCYLRLFSCTRVGAQWELPGDVARTDQGLAPSGRRSRFEKPALFLKDPRVDGSERGRPGL